MLANKLQKFNRLSLCTLTHLTSSRGFHAGAINLINNKYIHIDFKSLQKYKEIHGNLLIPQSYNLKLDATDAGPLGYKLGQHAKFIRGIAKKKPNRISPDNKEKLNEMEFVWNYNDEKFRRTIHALVHYRELYGSTLVPINYVVPTDDEAWSLDMRGLKLGERLRNLISRKIVPERLEYMERLGLSGHGTMEQLAAMLKDLLRIYKKEHSISEEKPFVIPTGFIVPSREPWPKYTWGIPLGYRIHNVRIRGDFQEYHEGFRSLGLDFELKRRGIKKKDSSLKVESTQDKEGTSLRANNSDDNVEVVSRMKE